MLLNIDRARMIMRREGLDALVAMLPHNVHYLSDHWCGMLDARWDAIYFAVLPAREDMAATLVLPSLGAINVLDVPTWMPNQIPITMPWAASARSEDAPIAFPLPTLPSSGDAKPTPNDRAKQELISKLRDKTAPSAAWALSRALDAAGASNGRVGFDDYKAAIWGQDLDSKATFVSAGRVFQEIRLIKTETEIARLRKAATANEAALRAAAATVVEGTTPREVQTVYMTEMARAGGHGVFLSVALGRMPHETFKRGVPTMFDAFGRIDQYHGDVGRTVVIGEPNAVTMRRTAALSEAWRMTFEQLRPGLRYSALQRMVASAARAAGMPEMVFCNPHNVGLTHTDDPAPAGAPPGVKDDIVLEPGMVVNIDMPYEEYGFGSIHTEDTVLITADGCEALTSNDTTPIIVA